MDRRAEALAQLLETALSERFATPVSEILQAVPIPVAVLEAADLRILAVNGMMVSLLDRPSGQVVGRRIGELLAPAHPMSDPAVYRTVTQQAHGFDGPVVLDGRPWRWFIRPLKAPDRRSVEHLVVGLVAAPDGPAGNGVARLQDANAAKAEFLNMAAHELRTPLNVIHGYGSLLVQGGLSADHQRLAGLRIYEKAQQLSRLITGMSLVARFDELGPDLTMKRLDLAALLASIVEDLQRRFPDLAIDLRLGAAPAAIRGNAEWLGLAVRELLDNAVRFRPGPTGRVDIVLGETPSRWSLSVLDDGFGIEPAEQGRLFKRFARVETEQNRHLVGLGIGLYLVREVALAHDGRVLVTSRPGLGSEFTLEIPRSETVA